MLYCLIYINIVLQRGFLYFVYLVHFSVFSICLLLGLFMSKLCDVFLIIILIVIVINHIILLKLSQMFFAAHFIFFQSKVQADGVA